MAIDKIGTSGIADNAVTTAKVSDGDITVGKLAPSLDLSSKTLTLTESSVTAHVTQFDDTNVRQDVATLAFESARGDNRSAYNLPNAFVDQFEDETGIDTKTSSYVAGEYLAAGSQAAGIADPITEFRWAKNGGTAYATWNFQGSNDNSNWTTLYTGYDVTAIGSGNATWGPWASFSNTTNYLYYRFYKTNGAQGGGYHSELQFRKTGSVEITDWENTSYITASGTSGSFGPQFLFDNDLGTNAFHTDQSGSGTTVNFNFSNAVTTTVSATGNFTSTTQTADSSVSSMSIVVMYEDNSGTAALNTDLVAQVSANNGVDYTTVTLSSAPNLNSTTKVAKSAAVSVTAGTQPKYKINFANQASGSKITRVLGVALLY